MEVSTPPALSRHEFLVLRTLANSRFGRMASEILVLTSYGVAADRLRAVDRDAAIESLLARGLVEHGGARLLRRGPIPTYRLTSNARALLKI